MYGAKSEDGLRWYVIRTKPQEEERAARNLTAWRVETFAPVWKSPRRNQFTGKLSYVVKPLFPRYIFARFDAHVLLQKINYTRGVQNVLNFGNGPTEIEDEIIAIIRSRVGRDGFVKMGDDFKSGDKVRITEGPMSGLVGIFERDAKDKDRVTILLTAISFQSHVMIERELIEKLCEPETSQQLYDFDDDVRHQPHHH